MGRKIWLVLFVVVAIGGVFIALFKTEESQRIPEQGVDEESTQSPKSNEAGEFTVVAEDLDTPWEIGFLPDGDFLVTERQGTLRVVGKNPVSISVPGVAERGEGGLLGLALHPDYAFSKFIYLYFTTEKQERITNQVVRYKFDGKTLSDAKIIIEGIPGASVHNGGRIAFGPDERLYITTG
ncbi:MAG: PQQ-dependent sugar dehydrogenase, partial [Candidatus Wildermuthbacteria bacterium]|nr:PQQ-dependent sugar dehydrogenase [Candidatus Wildermuthbacteria bacterium]